MIGRESGEKQRGMTRRTLAHACAWSIPTLTAATALPAFATSGGSGGGFIVSISSTGGIGFCEPTTYTVLVTSHYPAPVPAGKLKVTLQFSSINIVKIDSSTWEGDSYPGYNDEYPPNQWSPTVTNFSTPSATLVMLNPITMPAFGTATYIFRLWYDCATAIDAARVDGIVELLP